MKKLTDFILFDREQKTYTRGEVRDCNGSLELYVEGYGEMCAKLGQGTPIVIEKWNGKLQVVLYPNINREAAKVVSMEKAREENYKGKMPFKI